MSQFLMKWRFSLFSFYEDLVLRGAMHSVQCVRVAGVGAAAAATQLLTPTPLSPQTAAAAVARRRDRVWSSPATDK